MASTVRFLVATFAVLLTSAQAAVLTPRAHLGGYVWLQAAQAPHESAEMLGGCRMTVLAPLGAAPQVGAGIESREGVTRHEARGGQRLA